MKYHELANLFPMMNTREAENLQKDIAENGLREPICTFEGNILDGRNRFKACKAVGIEPTYREYSGDDPVGFVVSMNVHRRHLEKSQLAVIALDIEKVEAERAKERMSDGGKGKQKIADLKTGQARDKAAKAVGVNRQYVSDAKRIEKEAPELIPDIRSGKKNISQAKREIKERKREQRRDNNREKIAAIQPPSKMPISGARFSTIVIDPPWDFSDEGDKDQLGRARPDYAQLSIDEIAALPVSEMADDDSHIYLWITNRSLPKGFSLLEKWGFRYITCLTWCKPSFGMGNYFRGQTEQVLFGVKGSQPLLRKDVGTWFAADRGVGGHSSKPPQFFDLVESCSPGPYLEMFSRVNRDDWTTWGENDAAA